MNTFLSVIKFIWRALNFIRDLVMNCVFLLFVLLLALIVGLDNNHKGQSELNGDQGALLLDLNGYLADNRDENMQWQAVVRELNGETVPTQISTFDVIYAINAAKEDQRITGLVLDLNYFEGADWPALDAVGEAIADFKASKKPVIAYADNYSQAQYYLASFADEIYLNPVGQVDIKGLAAQNLYFKSMLEKLDITAHVFRVGTYKSAVEPFLRDDMSPEAKQNMSRWLNTMWHNYRVTVAENRDIKEDNVLPETSQYLQQLKALNGDSTQYALQRHLVTKLATSAEIQQKLTALFGKNLASDTDYHWKNVNFDDYLAALPDRLDPADSKAKIAVVNVEGTIVDGSSDEENVGGDTVVNLLQQAEQDDEILAVVLRVNSPGGSAFASEKIRQELEQLQKMGKPVVVSMGAMAASGGYWISSTSDYIVADRNTITGSIGIFAMFPTFENTIKKAGISTDGVSTSTLANVSALQTLPKDVADVYQVEIEHGYDAFLDVVSRGRKMSKDEVDKIAQGQVWLGSEAVEHKLVDEIGGFESAVDKAIELAVAKANNNISPDDVGVEWIVDEPKGINAFFSKMKKESKAVIQTAFAEMLGLPKEVRTVQKQLGVLSKFNDPKGQYLYCLNCAVVK